MAVEVTIDDYSEEFLEAFSDQVQIALEMCGLEAEGYAKLACPVDTGNLRNSITHLVENEAGNHAMIIGSNVEYAPYIEMGTGIYAEEGGRMTPWTYQDDKGNWHTTHGAKAQPFLRPAITDNLEEYRQIIESQLKNG